MNTKSEKKVYFEPKIFRIELDNEISLALESSGDPGEPGVISKMPEYFSNDHYNSDFS